MEHGDLVVRRVHDDTEDAWEEEVEGCRVLKLDPQLLQRAECRWEHTLDEVVAVCHLVLVELGLHDQTEVADVLEDGCHLLDAAVFPQLGTEEVSRFQLECLGSVITRLEEHSRHARVI